jgi:hypothetical protein
MKKSMIFASILLCVTHSEASEIEWNMCEFYAKRFSQYAYQYGEMMGKIIDKSTPNSIERKDLIDIFMKSWSALEDSEYLVGKELEKSYRSEGKSNSYIALVSAIRAHSLRVAKHLSLTEHGQSINFYQRRIETQCRAGGTVK